MSTALKLPAHRFFFFRGRGEDNLVHVESADNYARFRLDDLSLVKSLTYTPRELRQLHELLELHGPALREKRMSEKNAPLPTATPLAVAAVCDEDNLSVQLRDGRKICVPLAWLPKLRDASPAQRANWRLIAKGEGIHWPELDEDIHVAGLLAI